MSMEQEATSTLLSPTYTEVMERLILPSIANEPHSAGSSYIAVDDVYSAAPNDLVARHAQPAASAGTGVGGHGAPPFYFLSPVHRVSATRKSRTVAGTDDKQLGRWHTEAGRKLVQGSAEVFMSKFSYKEKTSSGGNTKPGAWLMTEYSIDGWGIVVAKIYRSPRRQATNVSPPSSTASTWSVQELESLLKTGDGAPTPAPSYMPSSSTAVTMTMQEIKSFLMSDDDDDAPGQV